MPLRDLLAHDVLPVDSEIVLIGGFHRHLSPRHVRPRGEAVIYNSGEGDFELTAEGDIQIPLTLSEEMLEDKIALAFYLACNEDPIPVYRSGAMSKEDVCEHFKEALGEVVAVLVPDNTVLSFDPEVPTYSIPMTAPNIVIAVGSDAGILVERDGAYGVAIRLARILPVRLPLPLEG